MDVELIADKITIYGPKVDGGYTVKLEVGEYEQAKIGELFKLPQGVALKVKIDATG